MKDSRKEIKLKKPEDFAIPKVTKEKAVENKKKIELPSKEANSI